MIAGGMSGTWMFNFWTVVWWLVQVRGLSLLTWHYAERLVPGDNCRCYGRYPGVFAITSVILKMEKTVETESEESLLSQPMRLRR